MSWHTCVATSEVVIECVMNEYILVLRTERHGVPLSCSVYKNQNIVQPCHNWKGNEQSQNCVPNLKHILMCNLPQAGSGLEACEYNIIAGPDVHNPDYAF